MAIRSRPPTKNEREAASALQGLATSKLPIGGMQAASDTKLTGSRADILQRFKAQAWLYFWSSPETTGTSGVDQLLNLTIANGDKALKKLARAGDKEALARSAGIPVAGMDDLIRRVSTFGTWAGLEFQQGCDGMRTQSSGRCLFGISRHLTMAVLHRTIRMMASTKSGQVAVRV